MHQSLKKKKKQRKEERKEKKKQRIMMRIQFAAKMRAKRKQCKRKPQTQASTVHFRIMESSNYNKNKYTLQINKK